MKNIRIFIWKLSFWFDILWNLSLHDMSNPVFFRKFLKLKKKNVIIVILVQHVNGCSPISVINIL